jgi:hypothetical protein
VNCFFVRDLRAPFGGAGQSGIGREGGTWSFDFYADVKNTVYAGQGWVTGDAAGGGRPAAEDPPPAVTHGAPPARPQQSASRRASGATRREGGKGVEHGG